MNSGFNTRKWSPSMNEWKFNANIHRGLRMGWTPPYRHWIMNIAGVCADCSTWRSTHVLKDIDGLVYAQDAAYWSPCSVRVDHFPPIDCSLGVKSGRCIVWTLNSTPCLFVLSVGLAKLVLLFILFLFRVAKYKTSWKLALESVIFPKWTTKCAVLFMEILNVNNAYKACFFLSKGLLQVKFDDFKWFHTVLFFLF